MHFNNFGDVEMIMSTSDSMLFSTMLTTAPTRLGVILSQSLPLELFL
jgi:hypothetical protein